MTTIERALLYAIILLAFFRFIVFRLDDGTVPVVATPAQQEGGLREAGSEPPAGAETAPSGTFNWDPASFSREGLPKLPVLTPEGRIPANVRLTDTQRAFLYASMMMAYANLLEHAKSDCDTNTRALVLRWQARHARTLANANDVLLALDAADVVTARAAHEALPADLFRTKFCPSIKRYLAINAYEPHPELVSVLAEAEALVRR